MLMALAPAFSRTTTWPPLEAVVDLEGVLQRERVDVDDDRRAARLRDDAGVVADLFLLRRDEQHFHAAARVGTGAGIENLVIEVDVLDVERDVLLGLPVDRLVQLGLGHHRQRDLLDDHRVARERRADVLGLEGLVVLEDAADRVGHGAGVDDGAVDDGIGRHRLAAERGDAEAFARGLQLDRLDCARSDVEPYDCLGFTKHTRSSASVFFMRPVHGSAPSPETEVRRRRGPTAEAATAMPSAQPRVPGRFRRNSCGLTVAESRSAEPRVTTKPCATDTSVDHDWSERRLTSLLSALFADSIQGRAGGGGNRVGAAARPFSRLTLPTTVRIIGVCGCRSSSVQTAQGGRRRPTVPHSRGNGCSEGLP